jgi:signal transduction histidine kinase/CheY-like chemotaxis protein
MTDTPDINAYLRNNVLNIPHIGLLICRLDGKTVSFNGWNPFVDDPAQLLNRSVTDLIPALAGIALDHPWQITMLHLGENQVDLHLVPTEAAVIIMLRDVSAEYAVVQPHQQRANEFSLANAVLEREKIQQAEVERHRVSFVAGMSHEFRTPLTSILGYARRLIPQVEGAQAAFAVDAIIQSGENLLGLVENLLEHAQLENNSVQLHADATSLTDVLQDITRMFAPMITEKGLALSADLSTELPEYVLLDQMRIWQILVNLVGNAVKFTDTGSVKITIVKQEDKILIKISDTGQGMAPDQLTRIFQAFYRAEKTSGIQGAGLGLSVVERLVRLMDGDVKVESTLGTGSCFKIRLPLIAAEAPKQAVRTSNSSKAATILVVDDDALIQTLIEAILVDAGFIVLQAKTMDDALSSALKYNPQAVMMDLNINSSSGTEATHRLRDAGYSGLIVAMSASQDAQTVAMFKAAGSDEFIAKPIDTVRLCRLFDRLR